MSLDFTTFPAREALARLAEAEGLGDAPEAEAAALTEAVAALGMARNWPLPLPGPADALAALGERLERDGAATEARLAFEHALNGRRLCVRAHIGLARRTTDPGL